MQTDVFISHSSQDSDWANALCAHLEGRKIRCWIAPRDVPAGGIWAEAIIDGIENTRVMVLLLSSHANASRQVINEVERAVDKGVIVLPVRLERVKPSKGLEYFLGSRHWLEALTPPRERRIEEVGAQIEHVLAGAASTPTPTPAPPPKPRARRAPVFAMLALVLVVAGATGVWWWTTRETATPATANQATPAEPVTPAPAATAIVETTPPPSAPVVGLAPATTAAPAGLTPLDVVLPDTVWVGALLDSAGASSECIAQVAHRTQERVSVVAYFPAEGANPLRWNGTLSDTELVLDGADANRQRLTLTARLAAGQLTGAWTNNGGRRGTFSLASNTGNTDAIIAGSVWSGPLRIASGGGLELKVRILNRQDARVSGRCAVAGQRNEAGFVGTVLGDRVFGTIQNLSLQGAQRVNARFSAVLHGGEIAGTWTSDAGLSGKIAWIREP